MLILNKIILFKKYWCLNVFFFLFLEKDFAVLCTVLYLDSKV